MLGSSIIPNNFLLVCRGTKDYDDFWNFLKRYQDFQRKKIEAGKDACNLREVFFDCS